MTDFNIGDRIRFTKTLTEEACGDHPRLLYASKGELGEIVPAQYGTEIWAKRDAWPAPFAVTTDEIEHEGK